MVSQVGLNTSLQAVAPMHPATSNASSAQNSLFNSYMPQTNDYSGDVLMKGIDFGQYTTSLNNAPSMQAQVLQQQGTQEQFQVQPYELSQNVAQLQNNSKQSFTSNNPSQLQDIEISELANNSQITKQVKTQNTGKILGATAGLLAPIVGKIPALLKGASVKSLFKLKDLAVTCPILAACGFIAGALLDGCFKSQKGYIDKKVQEYQYQKQYNSNKKEQISAIA